MYAGLTTADKGALLDAKARGAEWAARDKDDELVGFRLKPQKYEDMELNSDHWERTRAGNYFIVMPSDEPLQFIQWSDTEPVNIDLALAQIAEMELTTNSTPLTWNERINQMTARQRADFAPTFAHIVERARRYTSKRCRNRMWNAESMMSVYIEKWLNSPYTEGATK